MESAFNGYFKGDKVQLGTSATEYVVLRVFSRSMLVKSELGTPVKVFLSDDVNHSQLNS